MFVLILVPMSTKKEKKHFHYDSFFFDEKVADNVFPLLPPSFTTTQATLEGAPPLLLKADGVLSEAGQQI
jgi:hypothetical protein